MPARTYIPTLTILGRAVYQYATRNREKLLKNLSPEAGALLETLLVALAALLDVVEAGEIGD